MADDGKLSVEWKKDGVHDGLKVEDKSLVGK